MPGVNFISSETAFMDAMESSVRCPVVVKYYEKDSQRHHASEYKEYANDPRLAAIEFYETDTEHVPEQYQKIPLDEFPSYVLYRYGVPEKLTWETGPFKLRGMFGLEIRD